MRTKFNQELRKIKEAVGGNNDLYELAECYIVNYKEEWMCSCCRWEKECAEINRLIAAKKGGE